MSLAVTIAVPSRVLFSQFTTHLDGIRQVLDTGLILPASP
jgi:hypothetical protein